MIIEATVNEVETLADYCWEVYQDPSKRTTPPYHSKDDMVISFEKQVQSQKHHIWAYYKDEILHGVLCVEINHDICYSQSTGGPYIQNHEKYADIASVFLNKLKDEANGHECYFGLPRTNLSSRYFLESEGFNCVDDTVQMRVKPSMFTPVSNTFRITSLSEAHHEDYKIFHDTHYVGYYWNSKRLFDKLERWSVHLAYDADQIIGSTFALRQTHNSGEIYGTAVVQEYQNTSLRSELISEVSRSCLETGITELLNFVPEGIEAEAALACGYEVYDTYLCYYKNNI